MPNQTKENAWRFGDDPLLKAVDLGRMAYGPAFSEQQRVSQAVIDGEIPATVLLVEHDPVITVTPRKSAAKHVLASADKLAAMGIAVEPTNRGGDVTYHGPGQLVAYPILRLSQFGLNLGRYMRLLEEVVIATLARFDIKGHREEGATGVWVEANDATGRRAKICAMGVRVRRNVTMHGLALNVDPDLSHFDLIVPCGLHGRKVTSIAGLCDGVAPPVDEVKKNTDHLYAS